VTLELREPLRRAGKAFFIETFGCAMNVHDSEKVAGTLVAPAIAGFEHRRS